MYGFAVAAEARGLFRRPLQFRLLAQRHVPGDALLTVPAERRQAGDHVISRLDVGHRRPHCLNHPGGFVPQHARQRVGIGTVLKVQIGMTHAGGYRANQHLPWTGIAVRDVFDFEWFVDFSQYGRFHRASPLFRTIAGF